MRTHSHVRLPGCGVLSRARVPSADACGPVAAQGYDSVSDVRLAYDWEQDRVRGHGWVTLESEEMVARVVRIGMVHCDDVGADMYVEQAHDTQAGWEGPPQ